MIKDRFILNQLANAGNKTVYELILEAPYSAGVKPSDIATALADKTPSDITLNSKAKYATEDANGNRIVWEFTYQQTAVDETGWVITKVLEGGMAPIPLEVTVNAKYEGNGATAYTPVDVDVPNPSTGTLQITENGEGIDVSSYAYADVNVSGGGGGVEYPTFTSNGEAWSCDKTFNEVVALVGEYGDELGILPCKAINLLGEATWDTGEYVTDFDVSEWADMPDTVTAIFVFGNYSVAFADDGKFYLHQ